MIVRPNYLDDPYDRAVTVAMFRFMPRWLAQELIAALPPVPRCDTDFEIIEALRCYGQSG